MDIDPYVGKTVFCEVDSEDVVGKVTEATKDLSDGHTFYTIQVDYDRSPSSRDEIDRHRSQITPPPPGHLGVNDFEVKMVLNDTNGKAFGFLTEAEARAFVAGVKYVNDSSIDVLAVVQEAKNYWTVRVRDDDESTDEPHPLVKAVFRIGDEEGYEGLHWPDERWNGWACPFFTKEVAQRIVDDTNSVLENSARYNEAEDTFEFVFHPGGDINDPDVEKDSFGQTEDGRSPGKGLYSVGGWCWCWNVEGE